MGRGPKEIHAHLFDDLVIVRLPGVLTAAEWQLVQSQPTEKGRDLLKQVRIQLIETAENGLELAMLTASGGISYEDDKSTFSGAILSYDHAQSLIIVEGDEHQDCMLNGALVPWIEMNRKTDEILTQIQTPTTLQLTP